MPISTKKHYRMSEQAAHGWAVTFPDPQPFAPTEALQETLARARYEQRIPDTVLFLQHQSVVTLGRRGRTQHLLVSPDQLHKQGIDFHRAGRGGDVTYHAPGQWIVYPILRLGGLGADAHGYLHNMEEMVIRTCADFDVEAFRVPGKNGAWTEAGKIAAIGFHLKRGITLHGLSFNVDVDLAGFQLIVPCGLAGDPVCSLKQLLGDQTPSLRIVRDRLQHHFESVCGRPLIPRTPANLPV